MTNDPNTVYQSRIGLWLALQSLSPIRLSIPSGPMGRMFSILCVLFSPWRPLAAKNLSNPRPRPLWNWPTQPPRQRLDVPVLRGPRMGPGTRHLGSGRGERGGRFFHEAYI